MLYCTVSRFVGSQYLSFGSLDAFVVRFLRMHVRFSMCRGMAILDDRNDDTFGVLAGIFLHPDLGKVEGFFVRTPSGEEFLAAHDIAHWGRTIVVRSGDAIGSLEERVRLSALWQEGRTVIGQRMVTEAGVRIGTCVDVQFETDTFRLEWLFPRRWLRWKRPVPAGSIVEVRTDAIYVRDAALPAETVPTDLPALSTLETMGPA